ncbi:MAG TPA: FAA hydrolase family protein [Chloroflexi bacterium]|nr:MAG: fumarylacetoacetate hydrolase [Chloroflexota bacterium]HDD54681.1 FAA hydrolase family protein [Chloroflexota bacterium]
MKIATIKLDGQETACIKSEGGFVPVSRINQRFQLDWPEDLFRIIVEGKLDQIQSWFDEADDVSTALEELALPEDQVHFAPLYRHPRKIWGIGLNYLEHAQDLSERTPTSEPASFMKPDTSIIGFDDLIEIPLLSERTTGEAELGLIFGKKCRDVPRQDWESVLAGFTLILDMTAEDILKRNPRNLTQAKSFDTFFSFGPIFYTMDEVENFLDLQVKTVLNGKVIAENSAAEMTFPLDFLVSYHSRIMTLLPGDIILTGTPGAVKLSQGDRIECQISEFQPLINQVIDLKLDQEGG